MCAKIIGTAEFREMLATGVPNAEASLFRKGNEGEIIAVNAETGLRGAALKVKALPLVGRSLMYTDLAKGHSVELKTGEIFELPLDRSGILHGASTLEVVGRVIPEITSAEY